MLKIHGAHFKNLCCTILLIDRSRARTSFPDNAHATHVGSGSKGGNGASADDEVNAKGLNEHARKFNLINVVHLQHGGSFIPSYQQKYYVAMCLITLLSFHLVGWIHSSSI